MALKTKEQLVQHAKDCLGTPYVFGAKGEIMTLQKINSLAASYPSTFSPNYIAKAKKFIGKKCLDCSGLVSDCTKLIRGSSQYKSTATECVPISKLSEDHYGWGLWRQGHIGVYIGGGKCIEARGIDYGTVETVVSKRNFTHVIKLKDIDYTTKAPKKSGWLKENGIWHFYQTDGSMVKGGWFKSDAGYWYYFDDKGDLFTGWIQGKDGKWYYCDEDLHDEYIGKMITNRVIRRFNRNFYLGDDGVMVDEGHVLTFTVTHDGVMKLSKIR